MDVTIGKIEKLNSVERVMAIVKALCSVYIIILGDC